VPANVRGLPVPGSRMPRVRHRTLVEWFTVHRWPAWVVLIAGVYLALVFLRVDEARGMSFSKFPVYLFQCGFFVANVGEAMVEPRGKGGLLGAAFLLLVCLAAEVGFVTDARFASALGYDSPVVYLLDLAYFPLALPWAAGIAAGTLLSRFVTRWLP